MNKLLFTALAGIGMLASVGFALAQDFDLATAMPKDGDEVAVMDTAQGKIVLMFFPDVSPKHVANFKDLAKRGFYDGTRFHRCIKDFMIQGGDPNSKDMTKSGYWGTGGNKDADGKEVTVKAEFNQTIKHVRGVLSMARSQMEDSASSQFFIMHGTSDFLDGKYSSFGKVVEGLDVVDKIVVTGDAASNGKVQPGDAVVIKTVKIEKWPLSKEGGR